MNKLLIFGAGSHGRELAWVARRCLGKDLLIEFVVDDIKYWSKEVDGLAVNVFDDLDEDDKSSFVVGVGDPQLKKQFAEKMAGKSNPLALADESIIRSERVFLSEGSVVMPGCVVTTNVSIGRHAHLNIGCRVSHDVTIGAYSTLCPNVSIAGNVQVEDEVFVGISATIINGSVGSPLTIGEGAVIAAGACVTSNVPPNTMVAGVPATEKKTSTNI